MTWQSTARATAQQAVAEGLLTSGLAGDASEERLTFIAASTGQINRVVLIGGSAAIDPAVEQNLRSRLE